MSAICGTVGTKDKVLIIDAYHEFSRFPHDRISQIAQGTVSFGCLVKEDTPESIHEALPAITHNGRYLITADAIIDNRDEIFERLNLPVNDSLPDSMLIVEAYHKWGKECLEHMLGDFAFAIYDFQENRLFCARDHVGKRILYYAFTEDQFYFSSIMSPIFKVLRTNTNMNVDWLYRTVFIDGVCFEPRMTATPHKDIKQIPPASYLVFENNEIIIEKYWNPKKKSRGKYTTNEEYESAFLKLFQQAVLCRTRSKNKVAVSLSSGLDSCSVAAVAAQDLVQQGNELYGYTAVPFSKYREYLPSSSVADETVDLQCMKELYPNIVLSTVDSDGRNAFNTIDAMLHMTEQPYRYFTTIYWMKDICLKASQDGCAILLDGQSGNYTISFGDLSSYVVSQLKKGKIASIIEEIAQYAKAHNRNHKSIYKYFVKVLINDLLKQIASPLYVRQDEADLRRKCFLSSHLGIDYRKILGDMKKVNLGPRARKVVSFEKQMKDISLLQVFDHLGIVESKLSLFTGITKRDPTRDKRIVEFCMSVPPEQWMQNGIERSLIRRTMQPYLPDRIVNNYFSRGVQSSDWIQRLTSEVDAIEERLEALISSTDEAVKSLFNSEAIARISRSLRSAVSEEDQDELESIVMVLMVSQYIENLEKGEIK